MFVWSQIGGSAPPVRDGPHLHVELVGLNVLQRFARKIGDSDPQFLSELPNQSVSCRLASFSVTAREIPDTWIPDASRRPATEETVLLADKNASDDIVFTVGFGICDASILTDPSLDRVA